MKWGIVKTLNKLMDGRGNFEFYLGKVNSKRNSQKSHTIISTELCDRGATFEKEGKSVKKNLSAWLDLESGTF